ncbi:MAG: 5-formyltetrahydrofolate cyclo-ligase [Caldimicrobium sp.]
MPQSSLFFKKCELRKKYKALRESLSYKDWIEKSLIICKLFLDSPFYQQVKKIALYHYKNKEVNVNLILEKAFQEKEVYLPCSHLEERRLSFHLVEDLSELSPGSFGIPEPEINKPQISPQELDLILVPGLVFDRHKFRLGYGKGFYDTFLKETKAVKIGVAFYFQVIDNLPREAHDVKMDYILTEKGFF